MRTENIKSKTQDRDPETSSGWQKDQKQTVVSCFYVEKQVPFRIEEDGLSDNVFKDSTNL